MLTYKLSSDIIYSSYFADVQYSLHFHISNKSNIILYYSSVYNGYLDGDTSTSPAVHHHGYSTVPMHFPHFLSKHN